MTNANVKGKQLGRPNAVFGRGKALQPQSEGMIVREIAAALEVGSGTVHRVVAG